jgi:8-oxo-dGTP pyrophosphatase MutT (NUDIX family)
MRLSSINEELNISDNNFRIRSEVVIRCKDGGIVGIYKPDYILFPGGGIDKGENPEIAVAREAAEEADINIVNIKPHGRCTAVWSPDNILVDGFLGEITHFFTAVNGGPINMNHKDKEKFKVLDKDEVIGFLKELIEDPKQAWAKSNNQKRIELLSL